MNYQESREYIDRVTREIPSVLGLEHMRELMKRLGNPQEDLKYVHIAGTNGKGSVIAFLYSALSQAGYRVGRYVSPTLYSYRGRIAVAGQMIDRDSFALYLTQVTDAIQAMTADGFPHPTAFEIETAVAFLYFKNKDCDLVLLEVGMGGNLDATNIINNTLLAVLVSISMDHMSFLGNTLSEIAEKKAGIIKEGCHVVTVRQKPEVMEVICEKCRSNHAECTVADAAQAQVVEEGVEGQTIIYEKERYRIPLAGIYQKENAVAALNALKVLDGLGFPTTAEQKKEGLEKVSWNGRFTVLDTEPLFVVDGAHNPAAADMLVQSIEHYFKGKRLIYIMGVFSDKDYQGVIRKTAPLADQIFTIQTPDNVRALPAQKLAEAIKEINPHVEAAESVKAAVEKAYGLAEDKDVILAFGSLSFIGIMTEIVEEEKKKRKEQQND